MNYILFDGAHRDSLLPFTYTRPVADIRVGILTIREKWQLLLGSTTTSVTEEYLEAKFPMVEMEENIMINASFLPTEKMVNQIKNLKQHQVIYKDDEILAFFTSENQEEVNFDDYERFETVDNFIQIKNTWDVFSLNSIAIQHDFNLLTNGLTSEKIPDTVNCINKENIFLEKGVKINFAFLNATDGPIYIGKIPKLWKAL